MLVEMINFKICKICIEGIVLYLCTHVNYTKISIITYAVNY